MGFITIRNGDNELNVAVEGEMKVCKAQVQANQPRVVENAAELLRARVSKPSASQT